MIMDGVPTGYLSRRYNEWDGPATIKFQAKHWIGAWKKYKIDRDLIITWMENATNDLNQKLQQDEAVQKAFMKYGQDPRNDNIDVLTELVCWTRYVMTQLVALYKCKHEHTTSNNMKKKYFNPTEI